MLLILVCPFTLTLPLSNKNKILKRIWYRSYQPFSFLFVVDLSSPFLPLVTKLTGKTVQMVNIISGSHHHFKGWDQFTASCTVPCCTEEPARQKGKRSQRSTHLLFTCFVIKERVSVANQQEQGC